MHFPRRGKLMKGARRIWSNRPSSRIIRFRVGSGLTRILCSSGREPSPRRGFGHSVRPWSRIVSAREAGRTVEEPEPILQISRPQCATVGRVFQRAIHPARDLRRRTPLSRWLRVATFPRVVTIWVAAGPGGGAAPVADLVVECSRNTLNHSATNHLFSSDRVGGGARQDGRPGSIERRPLRRQQMPRPFAVRTRGASASALRERTRTLADHLPRQCELDSRLKSRAYRSSYRAYARQVQLEASKRDVRGVQRAGVRLPPHARSARTCRVMRCVL